MVDIEQKYKDLFNTYGGKHIRLIFYNENYNALYPSESLFPSEDLYPADMDDKDVDFEISDNMVQTDTLTIKDSLCSDENLNFGACEGAQFEIMVTGLNRNIVGREFLLTQSFADFELIRGIFTVESTPKQEDKGTRKIIAYDRMKRFDADVSGWYNALDFPISLKEFRKSLCDFIGVYEVERSVLVNDDITIEKTINPTSLKGRDILRYICQINGVFGHININGKLQYITIPKKDSINETIKIFKEAESEEFFVPDIDTVRIRQEEGDIGGGSLGDGENVYIIEGNYLCYGKTTSQLNQIAENIKSVISSVGYRPASITTNGAPWLEVGDRIELETIDGTINTVIMQRTSTGIQGAMDDFESTGTQQLTQDFNIETEIVQVKGLSAILKRTVEEVSNNLINLENNTESKFTQTSQQISAKVNKGDISSELSIEPGDITIKTNRLSWESLKSSMSKDGKIRAVDGEFSGDVTANTFKTIDGSIVLASGKLKITGAEIKGTANTSTLGCNIISVGTQIQADNARLYVNTISAGGYIETSSDMNCNTLNAQYVYASNLENYSDKRLKHNIKYLNHAECLRLILQMKPVSFILNKDSKQRVTTGLIANDVATIKTDISLYGEKDGFLTLPYIEYISLLIGSVKEQQKEIEQLKERVSLLENDT